MDITLTPIGYVKNCRTEMTDDHWSEVTSEIQLIDSLPLESLDGIESFSHLEIIYYLHKSKHTITGSEHPRENPNWPKVGIFAQRKKDRPNHLGLTTVSLVSRTERSLFVSHFDAIDGTPILDIKPVFQEFLPKGKITQPPWTKELMATYWST